MERTDIHRPSVIKPEDYRFVGFEYLKAEPGEMLAWREIINAHKRETGATYSHHAHGGTCHICGAAAVYTALFHHLPTNTYIRTGLDCTEKLDSAVDGTVFRKAAERCREAAAGKRKAAALLSDAGHTAAWEIYTGWSELDEERRGRYEESTVYDIVGRLVKYGSISDKAMNYVGVLLSKIANRTAIAAARAAETALAAPVPVSTERMVVRGEVLSTKVVETPYGRATKMLVKTAAGWKVWGTRPSSLSGAERGTEVEFEAVVERSRDDEKFGFFSRPTKGAVLAAATV